MSSILREVFSNRNILTISTTNMLYHIFNSLWELWWTLYLIEELHTPILVVGLLATIQSTSRILFQLPGGILADRVGMKRVIVFGPSLRVVAALILLSARSWLQVAPGIILNAVASLYSPAFNALIAESLPEDRLGAAFGAYRMMTSIPRVFMPVVSGYYLDLMGIGPGVRLGLLLFAVAVFTAALLRALLLTETLSEGERRSEGGFGAPLEALRRLRGTLLAMLMVSVISGFAMRMTWSFLSVYAYYVVGLSTTQYGLLQTVATGLSTPLYLLSGVIADRFGRVPCILVARGLGPIDSLSLLLLRDFRHLLAAYAFIGVAGGLGGGRLRGGGFMGGPAWQALIADLVPPRDRGKVMGAMATMTGLVALPAPYLGGYLYDLNPNLLLALGSLIEAMTLPIVLLFVREQPRD
ncbi:MAG: MFS transporter [Candidatus Bathyarchaeota archaeon B23]|nr:MAG: MFS transporter [Candidatus Bathyarchaeota archaeon B23]